MKDNYTTFINIYNEIETMLCKISGAPMDANMKWFEDTLTDVKIKNKLFHCRITRNYIQHNPDFKEFVYVTDGMIEFLKDIKQIIFNRITKANDIMIPIKKICTKTLKDGIFEISDIMSSKNYDIVPILENGIVLSFLTKDSLISLISNFEIKKTSKIKDLNDKGLLKFNKDEIKFISKDLLVENVLEMFENTKRNRRPLKLLCVTDNGNSKGNLIGIITYIDIFN